MLHLRNDIIYIVIHRIQILISEEIPYFSKTNIQHQLHCSTFNVKCAEKCMQKYPSILILELFEFLTTIHYIRQHLNDPNTNIKLNLDNNKKRNNILGFIFFYSWNICGKIPFKPIRLFCTDNNMNEYYSDMKPIFDCAVKRLF